MSSAGDLEDLEKQLREESRLLDLEKKERKKVAQLAEKEKQDKERIQKEATDTKNKLQTELKAKEEWQRQAKEAQEKAQAEEKEKKNAIAKAQKEQELKEQAQREAQREMERVKEEQSAKQMAEDKLDLERQAKNIAQKEADEAKAKAAAKDREKQEAEEEARRAAAEAKRERENRERFEREAVEAEEEREKARRDVTEAREKTRAEQRAKEEAEERARELEAEKERIRRAAEKAKQKQIAEQKDRERAEENARNALEDKRKAEEVAARRELINQTRDLENQKLQEDLDKLLAEKEENERKEAYLKQFKWGPREERKWTNEEAIALRSYILQHRVNSEKKPVSMKILVFGPTGNGKSSLCNGFRSALYETEKPSGYYSVAHKDDSHTTGFQAAQYGDHWIIDMAGIFESQTINLADIEAITSGRVPFYAELTRELQVRDRQLPTLATGENDVSCVVIVMKPLNDGIQDLGPELKRQIQTVVRLGGMGVLSYHLVLTHLDECDPQFKDPDRLPNLYQSSKVQAFVKEMSDLTGIMPFQISVVRNYVTETQTDPNTTILHLEVLERIMFQALEQMEKRIDQKRQLRMYKKNYCSMQCMLPVLAVLVCLMAVVVYLCMDSRSSLFKAIAARRRN